MNVLKRGPDVGGVVYRALILGQARRSLGDRRQRLDQTLALVERELPFVARTAALIGSLLQHHRDLPGVPLKDAVLEVSIETRDRTHAESIVAALREQGFIVRVE